MARNGSGTYSRVAGTPYVYGTVISETTVNSEMDDIATALTASIAKDGQTVPTANLPMGTYKHTNVGAATARTDYARASQVQDSSLIWCGTAGGTADAFTLSPAPSITDYAAGQSFRFLAVGTNTGAVTANVSAVGAKNVQASGSALTGGEIVIGKLYSITYDGTQFQLEAVSVSPFIATLLNDATAAAVLATLGAPTKADIQNQAYNAGTTGGTSTAYTLTLDPALTSLAENQDFDVEFHTAAGSTPTLAISGQTAKSLKYRDDTGALQAVTSTQIPTGWRSRVTYDGTYYIVREVPPPAAVTTGPTLYTPVPTTSGTSHDIPIPAGTTRFTLFWTAGSTNGTAIPIIQLGDSGGIETTGYNGAVAQIQATNPSSAAFSSGFALAVGGSAAAVYECAITFAIEDSSTNTWSCCGNGSRTDLSQVTMLSGSKSLSGALTTVRLTTVGGADTFDAGSLNISYE